MSVKAQMSKVEQETPQVTEAPIADKPAVRTFGRSSGRHSRKLKATIEKKIEESVAPSEPEIKEAEPVEAIQQTNKKVKRRKKKHQKNTGRSSRGSSPRSW